MGDWNGYPLLTIGGIRSTEDDVVYYELPIDPYPLVVSAFAIGTIAVIVARIWYGRTD